MNNTVIVVRKSKASGKVNSMLLPMSPADYSIAVTNWDRGMLIQDAFPRLNADQREFIMTGITPDEWDQIFGPEEDEGDY